MYDVDEYLGRCKRARTRMFGLENHLRALESEIDSVKCPLNFREGGRGSNITLSRTEALAEEIADVKAKYEEAVSFYNSTRREILFKLLKLSPTQERIMILRYVDCMTVDAVAESVGYSRVQIYRYINQGKKELAKILEAEDVARCESVLSEQAR